MNKTIKINISGIVFQIDEDAFEILRDYLQAINNRFKNLPDGSETIDDIESRIAEIFQSQKGLSVVISKENVTAMIGIIGKPEEFDEAEEYRSMPAYTPQRRRMYRNRDDSIISGVCSGIGAYLNIDPVWIRILFILFAIFYGIGFFIYIVLWIALPPAVTDSQKRELYRELKRGDKGSLEPGDINGINRVGHALNEVFRAIGKFFVISFRIILIVTGVVFVISGFIALLSFFIIFLYKFPGSIHTEYFNFDFFYLPDFLNYFLTPSLTSWVIVLISIAVALPLFAIIYWGIKMIFQFRSKDGIISLGFLLMWITSLIVLAVISFNQGVSFAENGSTSENITIQNPPDTLFLKAGNKISSLQYDNEIFFQDENDLLLINKTTNDLFFKPVIIIEKSKNIMAGVEVIKSSRGGTRNDAVKKAENLKYNYRISIDTVYVDEYFKVPYENKWSGAKVIINLVLPEGIVVYFDQTSEILIDNYVSGDGDIKHLNFDNKYWLMTEDGLTETR